ncbi:MAG: hypothetical protein J7493_08825 [Porphyrobacter sp.]|nr:hypothetical protein [Porphyrobacter sp.]
MSAAEYNLESTLARLLASRSEPPVPEDLARRIVVRTAHLPQYSNDDFARPAVPQAVVPAVATRSWRRASLPFGAALAASLVLALIVRPSSPEVQTVAPSLHSPSATLASIDSEVDAAPATVARPSVAVRTPVREHSAVQKPIGESTPTMLAEASPAVEPAETNPALSKWQSANVAEFALKDKGTPAPVYGPVLDPEPSYARSGIAGRGGSASGMAAASSRPTAPARPDRMP